MKPGDRFVIVTEGWAGRVRWPVEVVSVAIKRARVRILPCEKPGTADCGCAGKDTVHAGGFPGRRRVDPGAIVQVPIRHLREVAP